MISFSIFIILVAALGTMAGSFKFRQYVINRELNVKLAAKTAGILVLSLIVSLVQPIEVQRIDSGNVGLKIDRIGNEKGVPVAIPVKGYVFYNSWLTDIVEYSIRQEHIAYGKFSVNTKGGSPMDVAPSFNYSLKPEKAAEVYINLLKGGEFKQLQETWIYTATQIALKKATNEFPIDSIFNNQGIYQQAVEAEMQKEMNKYFYVSQINPGQITPGSMVGILQNKADAIQKAQQADLDAKTADAQAYAKIATAKGDSAALVIEASAAAEAIKLKTREISPTYVEYIKWLNAAEDVPRVPTTVLGSGTNVMLSR